MTSKEALEIIGTLADSAITERYSGQQMLELLLKVKKLKDIISKDIEELEKTKTKVKINIFDEEEIIENCTVQILSNSKTGDTSVGWWRN